MKKSDLSSLNESQSRAVLSNEPFIVAVAGPGSGKTHTLTQRILRLIESGVSPGEIVAITFTNAAAREIESRIQPEDKATGVGLGYAGTLHGFMLSLLNQHARLIRMISGITVIDQEQALERLQEVAKLQKWKGSAKDLIKCVKGGAIVWPFQPAPQRSFDRAELINLDYYRSLFNANALDFDSILSLGLELVKILAFDGHKLPYRHLFVDEFQDSCETDAEIYLRLPIANKFFVGDPDQAIYGFRGSSPVHMLNLLDGVEPLKPADKVRNWPQLHILDVNYRSDFAICEAATNLISHNTQRVKKAVEPSMYADHGDIIQTDTPSPEGELVTLNDLIQSDPLKGENFEGIAVLARSNALVSEIADFLASNGVPVKRKVERERPADWKLARAFLTAIMSPDNNQLFQDFVALKDGKERAETLNRQALQQYTSINAISYNFRPVSRIDYVEMSDAMRKSGLSDQSRAIIFKAVDSLTASNPTIGELLLAISAGDLRTVEEGEGVMVTTIHGAKGREWDSVYIIGCEQGLLPLKSQSADAEEERRMFFVAVTRARHRLTLLRSLQRKPGPWAHEAETREPSIFLKEILAHSGVEAP